MAILATTDFSDASATALGRAALIARRRGDALTVVHCVEAADPDAAWRALVATPWEEPATLQKKALGHLETFVGMAIPEGLRPDYLDLRVALRRPHVAIGELTDTGEFDLVVLGATGSGRLRNWALGSTAEHVVRTSTVPVLVVTDESDLLEYRTILAPVDLSKTSRASLAYAADLAREQAARLVILHAHQVPVSTMTPFDVQIPADFYDDAEERMREQLDALVDATDLSGVESVVRVASGDAFDAICETAEEYHADLICLGAHTSPGMRLLMGRTASRVLRRPPCSVLVFRGGSPEP